MPDDPKHPDRAKDDAGDRHPFARAAEFAELCESISPSLYAWAALRIHPKHRASLDPEDVVQDVWWRAMDAFARFDPAKGSFRSWVFRIATNVLVDGYRRLNAGGRAPHDLRRARMQSLPPDLVARGTSVSARVARDEDIRRLLESLAVLDREERALFAHCALEGLSPQDAGPLIGTSPDAAVKRWQRLRARIRESPIWHSYLAPDEPPCSP